MNIQALLVAKFTEAVNNLGLENAAIPVSRSTRPEFGDYQFNGAMALSKKLKKAPRDIAQQIVDSVDLLDIAAKLEIAGPGFINIHIAETFLHKWAAKALNDQALTIQKQSAETVVVDYSSPNLAKEMHVGHLRSTIIGDAVANVLDLLGHKVIRQNHMGDWGTQFGMLLAHLSDELAHDVATETALSDLEDFYRAAKKRFDNEDGFADRAREYVVKLQGGDQDCLALWQAFIDTSITHSEELYTRLNVGLKREHVMGESAYNNDLASVVDDLQQKQIITQDQGAQVAFLPEMADKEGNPAVYIVQKSGGGYLYATTDLAAIRYRKQTLKASRTLIFTDARQALHFKQTELVARKAQYLDDQDEYQHCPFGMMLGKDGKPFKTRSGDTVKLVDLLDEAVERASTLLASRKGIADDTDVAEIAKVVGIGAVKYADLSKNRTTDYVFDWDTMLSFEGNTAPYLQYAFTRIRSIFRKAKVDMAKQDSAIIVSNQSERELMVKLAQFEEVLINVAKEASPHLLCTYLYELASSLMRFYEASPILKDGISELEQASRLSICALTARTLQSGLDLLGINTLETM